MTQSTQFDPRAWAFADEETANKMLENYRASRQQQPVLAPQEGGFGRKPSTLPANFDPQEWVFRNVQDKDVTGMGTKYGEYFNSQVAKQRAAQQGRLDPVWIDNQFQHHLGEMEKFYTLQGFSPAQIEKIKAEFNQASNLAEQGAWYEKAWDHASDLAKSTAAATSGLTANVIGAFAPESEWHRDWKETRDAYANALSDRGLIGLNRQDQEFAQRMANGENEALAKLQSLWHHPLATANQATQVIPQVALAAATGGLSLGAVNAAASAGAYREEIRNAWKNLSPEQAMQMPQIQQRMAQGMTLEQAIEDASTDLSDNLAGIGRAAAIGGIDAISPLGKLGKGVNSGMLKTFGKEVTKEAAQEAIERGNRNYGVGQIDGKTQLMDDVQASAVAGAVLGVPTGAISAYDAYRNDSQAKRQSEAVQNAVEVESENAAPTPNQTEKAAQQFDENVLDETLSVIEDEQRRKDYKEELENDIKDGLIAERAKENSTYGKLAKAYLQATNPQQEIETEQVATSQPEAQAETEGLTQEQLDKQRAADLRSRMERWLNEEKVDDISDVISTPMTFTDDKAKVTFATRTAFGEIQRLAERNGIDPNDGNAIREWIEQDSEPHITITAEDIDKAQAQDNAQSSVQAQPYAQDNAQSSAQRKADVKNSNHSEFESLDPNEKAKYNRQLERIRKTYNINQADKEAEESTFRYLHSYGVSSDLYADKSNLHKAIAEQIKGFGYDKDSKRGYVGYNNEDGIVSVQGFLLDQKNTTGNAARTDSDNTATVIPMPSSPIGRSGKYQQSMSDEPLNKVYKLNERSTFEQIASIYDEAVTKAISSAAYTNAPRLQASFLYSLPLNVLNKLAKEFDQTGANSSSGKGFQFSPFASVANHKAELIKAGGNKAVQGWIKRAEKEEKLAEQAYKQLTSNPKQEKNNVDKQTSSVARNSQNTTDSAAQTRYSRSPIKSVEANIKRGREAMNTAIVERRTVHRAMYNHNLDGWVDFEWGDVGQIKPSGKTKGAMGIAHIIESRTRKDGMDYGQVSQMLTHRVVETLAKGQVSQIYKNGNVQSVFIDYNGNRATLIKRQGSNSWLMNAFEMKPTDGQVGSNDPIQPTHTLPTRQRQDMGAVGTDTVQQTTTQSNNQSHSDSVNIEQDRQFLQNTLGDVANQIELVSRADLQGHKQSAEGFFENGKAHLVTDNIKGDDVFSREERLAWVAWHELGHNGVNVRFSANHKNLMEFTRTNPVVNTLRRKIQQRYADMNIHINDDVATEEAIVELYTASQTNDWAKLEKDYNLRVHHSWKTGENSVRTFIENVVNKLRKIVGAVLKKDLSKATTADILSLLKQLNQDPHTENVSPETEQDTRYSLNESADSDFAKAVDAVAQGGFSQQTIIDVGTTPDVLKMLGLPDVNVTISGAVLRKVMQEKHNVTPETLKQLPKQINDPVAVMKSSTKENGYVVLTELTENVDGINKPIVAALHLKQTRQGLELINIASVYGRNNSQIQRGLENDLLYWNKEKGAKFLDNLTLQLRSPLSENSSIQGSQLSNVHWLQLPLKLRPNANLSASDIKTEADLRQYQNSKETRFSQRDNQELSEQRYNQAKENGETELTYSQWKQVRSPAFKAWFGDWENDPENSSKVINPKTGEPLVVYHGTSANFNAFDPEKQKNYRNQYGGGFYFTSNPDVAKLFGDNVMPVFLNARIGLAEKRLAKRKGQTVERDHLRPNDSRDIWVVYNPNQVKSALENNGEFSTKNDDIRYSQRAKQNATDDKTYLELAKRYEQGDTSVEPQLRQLVDQAAEEKGFGKPEYRMSHKAPNRHDDISRSIDDLSGLFPEDLYSPNGYHYYGSGYPEMDRKAWQILKQIRGNPEAEVTIYRAYPKGTGGTITNGDWVTIVRDYAVNHGENHINCDYEIVSKKVKANEVFSDGDSIQEQGYDNGLSEVVNHKKKIKLDELITYDDKGNIIPLSKRFNARSNDIRYSLRPTNRPKSESLEKLRQAKPIQISGKDIEPSSDLRQYKRNALNYGKTLRGSYVNKDTGQEIELGYKAVKEVLQHDYKDPDHLQSIAAIPQIIENAVYIDTLPNEDKTKRPDIENYDYYLAGLNIGGDEYTVRAAVARLKDGSRYYDHKLSDIEKGDLLSLPSRITNPVGESLSPLSDLDDKRLLQILQDKSAVENEENIRYSNRQSVDDLVKTGKAKAEPGLFDDLKAKDWEGFKKRINRATSKLDEWFADSLRPVNDWIDEIKGIVPEHIAEQLKGDMYRAKGVRDALNSELEQAYLKPLLRKLAEIASKEGPSGNKSNELDVKRLVGFWLSARYSIERNQRYLADEKKAMEDAEEALHEAEAQDDPVALDKARDAYRKAERQYRYRKADVESTNFGSNVEKNFKVGTAGGFSIPHARALMKRIETYVSRKDLESVAELVYDLNQARLLIDLNSGRFTQEAYDEYKQDRHYVPLTGDPRADDGFDFIGGAGQNALNIAKDKAHKGRKTSEAEDAIDATWKAVGKTTAYAGMVDFKNRLDEIYENEFHRLREKGFSEPSAKEQVEETLGISKKKMQGTTRTSDNVLIRKQGHSYYEYHLPNDVIRALKRDNVEQVNALLRLVSKPTGWYARGVTQWTLTFSPQNMLRDTWEKSEFIRVQKLYRNGKKVDDATMDKIGRGLLKYALSDKGLWTATKRFGFGQALREDVEDERLLKRLLELGGVSTYSTYLARTEKDLVKKVKAENSGLGKRLEQVGSILEGYNKTFDTVSSLAAFKSLIKNGIDEKQAAAITLELTNFRKQGSAMAPIKALYMFSQPTAMGARNLYKFLSHPKGRKRFFAYMAVMMPFYLALRAFDDEDEGGNKMDQLGDISRYIPIPAELGKYIKLPVGFGMPQLAWNFSVNLVKAFVGDISNSEAAVNMLVHTMKTFAPISPSEISAAKYPIEKVAMTATPTILQPLMQIALNRNAFGSQITTNFVRDDKLKAEQAKSTTAQFWKDVALQVHDVFGIDAHPEQIKNLFDGYGSIFGSLKEVQTIFVENPNRELLGRNKRTPFFNQLYGAGNEFAIMSRYYEASDEAQSLFKEYESRKARGKLDGWLTPQKRAMIQFHQIDKKRMAELRAEKSKLTRDLNKGRLTPAGYEARLKLYNQKTDKLQRILLKRWREMNGLNTH